MDIWHVDPCTDGSDDSCGWSRQKVTKEQYDKLKSMISLDLCYIKQQQLSHLTDINLVTTAWNGVVSALDKRRHWETKPYEQFYEMHMLANNIGDGFVGIAERMRKYPNEMDDIYTSLVFACARNYLTLKRKWWQTPKWHVHHYKINIMPLRKLRRFLFDRCKICNGRFHWGESPTTDSWDARKFSWWKSDPDVYHSSCSYRGSSKEQCSVNHK